MQVSGVMGSGGSFLWPLDDDLLEQWWHCFKTQCKYAMSYMLYEICTLLHIIGEVRMSVPTFIQRRLSIACVG